MKKRITSIVLAVFMAISMISSTALAVDIQDSDINTFASGEQSPLRLATTGDTTFLMQRAVVTPVVVAAGSTAKIALKSFATETSLTKSVAQSVFWDSYRMSGFNQYIIDHNYQVVGWNISLTGKYTIRETSAQFADKLKYFEYTIDDRAPVKVDIQYSLNRVVTYSWFVEIGEDNSARTEFNWKLTYTNGVTKDTNERKGRFSSLLGYYPDMT